MYHSHRILSSVIWGVLHSDKTETLNRLKQWFTYYNELDSIQQSKLQQINLILSRESLIDEDSAKITEQILWHYNKLYFPNLDVATAKEFEGYFQSLFNQLNMKNYNAQTIMALFLEHELQDITDASEAMYYYASSAMRGLTITQLTEIYQNFLKNEDELQQTWQISVLNELYRVVRQQLLSTRISNDDILSFRNFELYNSLQERIKTTRLNQVCSKFSTQSAPHLWCAFYLRVAKSYNKYKGLLTYLDVREQDFFKEFCVYIEERMEEQKKEINSQIDVHHLSPGELEKIERILLDEGDIPENAPQIVVLLYARQRLSAAFTELHLLLENNYIQSNSDHRVELHQYYKGLDVFQKQQLVRDIKGLTSLTQRLITQPYLAARVLNDVIIQRITNSYYPDQLYTNRQIHEASQTIKQKLTEIDFSDFFQGMHLTGKFVNKFISKVMHSPRPFHNEEEFMEAVIKSLAQVLGAKQLEVVAKLPKTSLTEVQKTLRQEVLIRLKRETRLINFFTSRVNRKKRTQYKHAKTLKKMLV